MEDELLFTVEESLSPYAAFLKKHGILFYTDEKIPKGGVEDDISGETVWRCYATISRDKTGCGANTEREAAYALAMKHSLEGWETVNWDDGGTGETK